MKKTVLHFLRLLIVALAAAVPARATLIDDATFFSKLKLTPGGPLESVRVALGTGGTNYAAGRHALVVYLRNRTTPLPAEIPAAASDVSDLLDHKFEFKEGEVFDIDSPSTSGDPDWSSVPSTFDTAWYANLVRFDWVNRVIANYRAASSPNPNDIDNVVLVIADYIADVVADPAKTPEEAASDAGELQASVRMAAWTRQIFAFLPVQRSDLSYVATDDQIIDMLKNIWVMADYTTTHSLGFTSNRGMLQVRDLRQVAGTFPEFNDAADWDSLTRTWAAYYFPANVHANGVLGEATTHYHAGQIEAIDTVLTFDRANSYPVFNTNATGTMSRMLSYWMDTTQPNQDLFLVGDSSSDGREANMAAISVTAPLERFDAQYVATQGANGLLPAHTSIMYGQGTAIMRTDWSASATAAFIENQPSSSHSHPDDLAFSLYAKGTEMLSNSGRLTYTNSNLMGQWHDSETEANSTVEIDERPMRPFAERINQWTTQANFDYFDGQYTDGFDKILTPQADTFVRAGIQVDALGNPIRPYSDRNFSKDPSLSIRSKLTSLYPPDPVTSAINPSEERIVYLRFRPGVIVPTIDNVSLQLYLNSTLSASTTLAIYGIPRPAGTSPITGWDESGLSWDSDLAHHPADDAILTGSDLVNLGTISVLNAGWVTINSTALKNYIINETTASTGTGYITLALCDPNDTNRVVSFSSKEGLNPPRLEIQVGSSPARGWADAITHRRKVYFDRTDDLFIVSDLLTGQLEQHRFKQMWSLGTTLTPSLTGNSLAATTSTSGLRIVSPSDSGLSAALADGWITKNPRNPGPVANKRLEYMKEGSSTTPNAPIVFETLISAKTGSAPTTTAVRRTVKNSAGSDLSVTVATALKATLTSSSELLYYFTAHTHDSLYRRFDNFATDGELAVVRTTSAGVLERVDLRKASYVRDVSGTAIDLVASTSPIPDLSAVWVGNGTMTMTSSKSLSQDLTVYSTIPLTAISFNGETFTPVSAGTNLYKIERKLLYSTDFTNGVASTNWTFGGTGGNSGWSVDHINGNRVLAHSQTTTNSYATIGSTSGWSGDTIIDATVQASSFDAAAGYVGLIARYASASAYYHFIYDYHDLKLKILKKSGSSTTSLGSSSGTFVLPLDTAHHFRAILTNSGTTVNLVFQVDGTTISGSDSSGFWAGAAGVIERKAGAWFDDFRVTGDTGLTSVTPAAGNRRVLPAYNNSYASDRVPVSNNFFHFHIEHGARLPVLGSATTGSNRMSYVKFRLADLVMTSASKATLRLYGWALDYETSSTDVTVGVQGVPTQTWNDRQLTWDTAPAGSACTTVDVRLPKYYDIDVSSYVAAHIADEFITFRLVDTNNAGREVNFFSNVYAASPQLVVEDTTTTP